MNGVGLVELNELLRALDAEGAASSTPPVLATIVSLDGSVYGRAGAMALLVSGAAGRTGVLALDEADELAAPARRVIEAGKPALARLTISEESALPSWGFGAPGEVEVFLEPADAGLRGCLEDARRALLEGRGVVLSLDVSGPNAGRRRVLPPEDPTGAACFAGMTPELDESMIRGALRRVLLCPIHAMGKVLIFGSSRDASWLARHLFELGFTVFVGDPRPGRLRGADWDRRWGALIEGGWEQVRAASGPDADTSIVVMTHDFALDLETLQGALASPAPYVGVPGPQKRVDRLLAELKTLGVAPAPGTLFAPAGLDIGAEVPRETALAIAAEVLAVRSGRKGGRPVARRQSAAAAPHAQGKVAGLVLAAGRGKRFSGGEKLLAAVDGQPVLRRAVENALASRLDPVIVVLGHEAGRALEALRGLDDPRLRVVFNPRWEGGKSSSIECGLREAPWNAQGVVSLLGDMPRVAPWLIDRVIAELEVSGKLVFPIYTPSGAKASQRGYPTAFPRALFSEIRALTGDGTADEAVRRHWSEAVKIPLKDASTQADVDTPEDLELLKTAEPDLFERH
jgi:molybdenum cofactor cytidylyltransferase